MSLTTLLASLIIPLNLSIALLGLAAILFIIRWRKLATTLAACGLAWSVFWSLPTSTLWAGGLLEQRYPHESVARVPAAQAIVVLGGNTANGRRNWFEPYDQKTAVLRTDTANQLYRAQRAPIIVVSGAALDGGVSEATLMANALEEDGVPKNAILRETQSLTTHQNAVYTLQLLREHHIQRFLLVTSALHMPRAMASFEKLGTRPIPAPSPPQIVVPKGVDFSFWLPSIRTLQASRSIIKEYLGILVYWLRNWV